MIFELEATPEELATKGETLIKSLAMTLRDHDPELVDKLEKSIHEEQKMELRDPYLRELHEKASARYQRGMSAAHSEIVALFDGLSKSEEQQAQSSLIESLAANK